MAVSRSAGRRTVAVPRLLLPVAAGAALLRMPRRVRAAVPATIALRATVVGAGPQLEAVRHTARTDGMARWANPPGLPDHTQLQSVSRTADVFVAPTRLKSCSIAALEAWTSGLAILARDGTGTGDFVENGVDGLLSGSGQEMAHRPLPRRRAHHAEADDPRESEECTANQRVRQSTGETEVLVTS